MSNAGKKTTVKDEFVPPQIKIEEEQKSVAVSGKQQIEAYLQRKAEVTQKTMRPSRTISTRKRKRCLRYKTNPRSRSHPSSTAETC